MIDAKVCIIGGGPAGATASLFLAKHKVSHFLVDRAVFPRDKVCGEAFDGLVHSILNQIDPFIVPDMLAKGVVQEAQNFRLASSANHQLNFGLPAGNHPKLHGRRLHFDHYLMERVKATGYATVLEGVKVETLTRREKDVRVTMRGSEVEEIYAQLVIVAAGASSPLVGQLMPSSPSVAMQLLFARAYFREQDGANRKRDLMAIYLVKHPIRHYIYTCGLPDEVTNVELAVDKAHWERAGRPSLKGILEQTLRQHPDLVRRFREAALLDDVKGTSMSLSNERVRYSGERFLLAGASSAAIHPSTGYGVGQAMAMGRAAAAQAAAAVGAENYSAAFLKEYDRVVRKKIQGEIMASRLVVFMQKHLLDQFDAAMGIAAHYPPLQQLLMRMVFG